MLSTGQEEFAPWSFSGVTKATYESRPMEPDLTTSRQTSLAPKRRDHLDNDSLTRVPKFPHDPLFPNLTLARTAQNRYGN
jgi:hypothetical protein